MDASAIALCQTVFDWARFGQKKGVAKKSGAG